MSALRYEQFFVWQRQPSAPPGGVRCHQSIKAILFAVSLQVSVQVVGEAVTSSPKMLLNDEGRRLCLNYREES